MDRLVFAWGGKVKAMIIPSYLTTFPASLQRSGRKRPTFRPIAHWREDSAQLIKFQHIPEKVLALDGGAASWTC